MSQHVVPYTIYDNEVATNQMHQGQVVRVVLVDTHKIMRQALQRVVTAFAHIHIIACLSSIDEVEKVLVKEEVHTVVLGPSMSISDCLSLLTWLNGKRTSYGTVIIQQRLHPETALTLVKKGIHGLLDELASEQDLANAISAASIGNTFLSRQVHDLLLTSMSKASIHLTGREMQVLSLLRDGKSNFHIARALGLKEKTIEKYLSQIYEKFRVSSRAEAILYIQKMHI